MFAVSFSFLYFYHIEEFHFYKPPNMVDEFIKCFFWTYLGDDIVFLL